MVGFGKDPTMVVLARLIRVRGLKVTLMQLVKIPTTNV
jgi:hypothetical protein